MNQASILSLLTHSFTHSSTSTLYILLITPTKLSLSLSLSLSLFLSFSFSLSLVLSFSLSLSPLCTFNPQVALLEEELAGRRSFWRRQRHREDELTETESGLCQQLLEDEHLMASQVHSKIESIKEGWCINLLSLLSPHLLSPTCLSSFIPASPLSHPILPNPVHLFEEAAFIIVVSNSLPVFFRSPYLCFRSISQFGNLVSAGRSIVVPTLPFLKEALGINALRACLYLHPAAQLF